MTAVIWGILLTIAVFAFIAAAAFKAQRGIAGSGYLSMMPYGKQSQLLQDKSDLQRFGLPQALFRGQGVVSAMGMSLGTMGLVGSAAYLYGPALLQGGSSVIVFGLPVIGLFSVALGASLAGLASAVPTAGGVAHAAYALGGRKWGGRAGWNNMAGHTAMLALAIGACADLADRFAAMRFGYSTSPLTFCAAAALVGLSQAAVNHWGAAWLPGWRAASVWLQLLSAALLVGSLAWLFWPGAYSPVLLYQGLTADYGAAVQPASFMVGALLLLKLFTGMDGAGLGAEETIEPRIGVPWAIYLSSAYTFIVGFTMCLFMTSVLPSALNSGITGKWEGSRLGAEGTELFLQSSLAGWGGKWIVVVVIVCLWSWGQQSMSAASRAMFSLARDGAMPFAAPISAVSLSRRTPVFAVWLSLWTAGAILAVAMLFIKGQALYALLSISVICLHISYAIPIGLKLARRTERRYAPSRKPQMDSHTNGVKGPWQLGDWSKPIDAVSFVWLMASSLLMAIFIHRAGLVAAVILLLAATVSELLRRK